MISGIQITYKLAITHLNFPKLTPTIISSLQALSQLKSVNHVFLSNIKIFMKIF